MAGQLRLVPRARGADPCPPQVLLTTGQAGGVLTAEYFALENGLVHELLDSQAAYMAPASVFALSYFAGADVPLDSARALLTPGSAEYGTPAAGAYRARVGRALNADLSAAMVTIETTVPPNSQALRRAQIPSAPSPLAPIALHLESIVAARLCAHPIIPMRAARAFRPLLG